MHWIHNFNNAEEQGDNNQLTINADAILARPPDEMFTVTPVQPPRPAKARVHNSVTCAGCGEAVMETRSRLFRGESYCGPCFEKRDRRYTP